MYVQFLLDMQIWITDSFNTVFLYFFFYTLALLEIITLENSKENHFIDVLTQDLDVALDKMKVEICKL